MKTIELIEHYDFYVDNCSDDEIPLSFEEWVREYHEDLELITESLKDDNHEITILWGECPEPDDEPITYNFDTKAELNSFMRGILAGDGWFFWTVVEKEYYPKCFKCESKLTTDPDKVSEGYAAACLNCDEDMYDFEITRIN